MSKVMVVEDQERIRTMLVRLLTAEGHETTTATDGRVALDRMTEEPADLVLLDLVMPRFHGLQVLAALRDRGSSVPVIVLSAVSDVAARVQALDMGAIDYVVKPFSSAELLARVRRHLSQGTAEPADEGLLEAGGITLDLDRRRARVHGVDVPLTERETDLLAHLMRRQHHVCRRSELLHDVWGLDYDPGSNVVEACVRRLRAKLLDPPIETVRGVGYAFEAG